MAVSPKKCHATGKGLRVVELGESASAFLHVVDYEGYPYTKPVENLICELVSEESNGEKIVCAVEKTEVSGEYEISYKPVSRGRHQLHIKVEGGHIKESPFPVFVLNRYQLSTAKYAIDDKIKWPNGVAVNSKGHIIVVERGAHCVSIFNSAGEKVIPSFGSFGTEIGEFNEPRGVAVDDKDNILVVDSWNHRIQKFTSDGAFIIESQILDHRFHLKHPAGIAIHPYNKRVYVADNNNHCIKILNPDLTLWSSFGYKDSDDKKFKSSEDSDDEQFKSSDDSDDEQFKSGSGNGQFKNPYDVAFDSTGKVYVADQNNHRVQVFTAEGDYLKQFGSYGSGSGELNGPNCICIDAEDVVYVTEWHNNRVSLFACGFSEPRFLISFGSPGSNLGQYKTPYGIALDKDGNIYVADLANNRIQVF